MKDILGFEGHYKATKDGKIWSPTREIGFLIRPGRFIKPELSSGYYRISVCKNNVVSHALVHRLIAQTYLPNPENKPQVNHKNGIKTDNRVENLEWCTVKENVIHAYKNGLFLGPRGERNRHAKLTEKEIIEIRREKLDTKSLAKRYKVSLTSIRRILSGKTWKHI